MAHLLISLLTISLFIYSTASAEKAKVEQPNQNIVELRPGDFKPTFTKETVIKLNAIVSRSLDIINEYDAVIENTQPTMQLLKTNAGNKLLAQKSLKISALSKRSKENLLAMQKAEKQLKSSNEEYNSVVFAGMMTFVQDVERETSAKSEKLIEMLHPE